jgi:multiple sugar transport system ATP-binding protein
VVGVTVVRGRTTVLDDLTLQADDGELLVVLGSSGSGKSTLLRVLAGLHPPDTGDVLIKGRRVTGMPTGQRRVSMVFQADALFPFLDVAHNLGWGLRIQHRPEAEVEERVSGRARQLRLGRLLPRKPHQLSGGERGLVGIGHALVQTPDLFLLDEPLGDLDAQRRVEVRRQIVEIIRSVGATAFYVTHDPVEGMAVADRMAVLHEGRVRQVGRPRELYDRPTDLFVAQFLGDTGMGLLPARLVDVDGQAGFQVGQRTLPLWRAVPPPLQAHVGRDVVLGLRAQDVRPPQAGHGPDSVTLDAVVTQVEYTGQHNLVRVLVDAPQVAAPGVDQAAGGWAGATLHSCFPPRVAVALGGTVPVAVEGSRAHVFDAVTGRALWHPDDGGNGASTP